MEDARLAKAVLVSDANKNRKRTGDALILISVSLAALSKSPEFFLSIGWVNEINNGYILIYGMILLPLLCVPFDRIFRRYFFLKTAVINEYTTLPLTEMALISSSSNRYGLPPKLHQNFTAIRSALPVLAALVAVFFMFSNYLSLGNPKSECWSVISFFISFEEVPHGFIPTRDGLLKGEMPRIYTPWLTWLYSIFLCWQISAVYQHFRISYKSE